MAYRVRRGRGQFTAPTSRSGQQYTHAGRRVILKGENFQLSWNGPEIMAHIMNSIVSGLQDLSDEALDYMHGKVPVRTGDLRDSCFVVVSLEGSRIRVEIGATMKYAVYVELGTSKMSARPYIRPTYDFVIANIRNFLRDEVKRRGR